MLVDCPLETPAPLQALATASAAMYPEFAHELELESGMKVDLRDKGTLLFISKEHLRHPLLTKFGPVDLEKLEPVIGMPPFEDELEARSMLHERDLPTSREMFAELCRFRFGDPIFLKERSVDPRALTTAAIRTAKNRGVDFSSGDSVVGVHQSETRVTGVTTTKTSFAAHKVVNCAGAWAGAIAPITLPTRPVKGQMLCLAMPKRELLQHVVRTPKVYLIPRSDGRLLIGATVEEAGFDKSTVPSTIQRQHQAALEIIPQLRDAKILEDWAGLRPGTPDALPILGESSLPGYFVATGHFRDGILLAPITARVMADVIEGHNSGYDLSPFSPLRFTS